MIVDFFTLVLEFLIDPRKTHGLQPQREPKGPVLRKIEDWNDYLPKKVNREESASVLKKESSLK